MHLNRCIPFLVYNDYMADLNYIDRDLEIKIVGQDSTGDSVNYVTADVNGNMAVKDYADGPVAPGTVASVSTLIGGQYNTVLPTLTNTQQAAVQVDASGRLIISPTTQGLLAEDHNWGAVGANTLRVASEIGNASGAADFAAGNSSAQTLRVVIATNQSTLPTQDVSDGSVGGGTAGTFSQLAGGVYNTTLPTLTNGQQAALQLNSFGYLLVAPPLLVSPATQNITVIDSASTTTIEANGQNFITGTPTAGSAASFVLTNEYSIAMQVTGTWTGTLQIEISLDGGTTWSPNAVNQDGTSYILNAFSGNFTGRANTVGYTNFRIRAITAITGTAIVRITEAVGINTLYINNALKLVDNAGDTAAITANGNLEVADIINVAGQYRAQSVTTTAAEALGAATILANRKSLSITPTNGIVYWGFSNAVTTTTGTPIFKNQTMSFAIGSALHVYVIAGATTDCRMTEGS